MPFDNIYVLDVPESRSSFIKKIEYNKDTGLLCVYIRPYNAVYCYEEVGYGHALEFSTTKSIGNYYNEFIKPNFKQIKLKNMADVKKERPKTKNQASNQKRFIKMSINVREIKKEWIMAGEKGDYLGITLHMLPDGELDKFGNLGMITQDVPSEVYKAAEAEKKGSGKDIKGSILGNAAEFDWGNSSHEGAPGTSTGSFVAATEGLPF